MLRFSQPLRFIIFAALGIMLLAGGMGKSAPSYAATPAATQSALSLGQSYTTQDQKYHLSYPDGWLLKEEHPGVLVTGTSQAAIDAATLPTNPTLEAGQAIIEIEISAPGMPTASQTSMIQPGMSILSNLVQGTHSSGIAFGAITNVKIGDITAGRVEVHYKDSDGLIYAFYLDQTPVLVGVLSAPGEATSYEDTLMAEALSITPTSSAEGSQSTPAATQSALSLGQSYTTQDKRYTLSYPDGWILKEDQPGLIAIGTSQAVIDAATKSGSPTLTTGQVAIELEINPPGSPPPELSQDGQAILKELTQSSGSGGITYGDITPIEVGSSKASQVAFHNKASDGLAVAYLLGKVTVLIGVLSAPGEMPSYEGTLIAVAASITPTSGAAGSQATPPATQAAATKPQHPYQVFVANDNSYAANFPASWVARGFDGDGINVLAGSSDDVLDALLNSKAQNFNYKQLAVSIRGYTGTLPDGLDASGDLVTLVKTSVENVSGIKQHDDIKKYSVGLVSTAWTIAHFTGIDVTVYGFFLDKTPFIVTEYSTPNDYNDTDTVDAIIDSIKPGALAGISTDDLAQVDLPQPFTSPLHGGYSANLPKAWVGSTQGSVIYLSSSQDAMDAVAKATQDPVLAKGQVTLVLITDAGLQGDVSDPADQLGKFLSNMHTQAQNGLIGTYQIGDIFAARTLLTGKTFDGAVYILPVRDGSLPVIVLTAPGEFAANQATIEAILASFK